MPGSIEHPNFWKGRAVVWTYSFFSALIDACLFRLSYKCDNPLLISVLLGHSLVMPLLMVEALARFCEYTYVFCVGEEENPGQYVQRSWGGYVMYAIVALTILFLRTADYYNGLIAGGCKPIP